MMNSSDLFILIIVAIISYWLGANSMEPGVSQGAGVLTDTSTGIDFITSKKFSVAKPALSLAGIGTRKKAILNVYSLGFYVSAQLQKQINKSSLSVCRTIQDSSHPKAVELTFAMGVGPEKIAEAISQLDNVGDDIKQKFHSLILQGMGSGKMKKGESMTFEWKGVDTIVASARGKVVGEMKDKALAAGVLMLYLDDKKSVSPTLLQNLGC